LTKFQLHEAKLVEKVRLRRLRTNRRQAHGLGRACRLDRRPDGGERCPRLGITGGRVEYRRYQDEDALCSLECGRQRGGISNICARDLAAMFRPYGALADVAQHGADRQLRGKPARDGAADLAGYSSYDVHDGLLRAYGDAPRLGVAQGSMPAQAASWSQTGA
jgi:hypothetical protein